MTSDVLVRIEPIIVATSLEPGLAARTYDPAWFLAVQWMLGEFAGDDAGTPVAARLFGERDRITRTGFGSTGRSFDPGKELLEASIFGSCRRSPRSWSLIERIETGNAFAMLLVEAGAADAVQALLPTLAFGADGKSIVDVDEQDAVLAASLVAARSLDGQRIALMLGKRPRLGLPVDVPVEGSIVSWRKQLVELGLSVDAVSATAWEPGRLEYTYWIETKAGLRLEATAHRSETIDWMGADLVIDGRGEAFTSAAIPTPLRFRGMPNTRYWEFEEQTTDLGSIEPASGDLVRLALSEMALVYGNDIFLVPLAVEIGSLVKVTSVELIDTFGHSTRSVSATQQAATRQARWSFCSPVGPSGTASCWHVQLPIASDGLAGRSLEQIALRRDEYANIVWGVETRIEGQLGETIERLDRDRGTTAKIPLRDGVTCYKIMQGGHPSWFPMPLRDAGPEEPRMLVLQKLATFDRPPLGRLLPQPGGSISDEEVPPEGLSMRRRWRMGRSIDGTVHVWEVCSRDDARTTASPSLTFDGLDEDT